jgi:hypothetical protein
MKISFEYNYKAQWGQEVYLVGSISKLGEWKTDKALPLVCVQADRWRVDVDIDSYKIINYKYFIKNSDGSILWIENSRIRECLPQKSVCLCVKDSFYLDNRQQLWQKSAFTEVLFKRKNEKKTKSNKTKCCKF